MRSPASRWDEVLVDAPRHHLLCPPDYWLPGMRRREGYVPFGQREPVKDVVEELSVMTDGDRPGEVTIRLVTPNLFTRLTGEAPESIDPDSAYKGWRLP